MSGQPQIAGSSLLAQAMQSQGNQPVSDVAAGNVVPLQATGGEVAMSGSVLQADRRWQSAIKLVAEAQDAIRIGKERSAHLEAEIKQIVSEAAGELSLLKQKIQQMELELAEARSRATRAEAQVDVSARRANDAEQRASEAMRRANDAEAWLIKLHDSVFEAFSSLGDQALNHPVDSGRPGDLTS
jgi:chromosome segregation ATPase